uniref:Neural cell adhesion molecule L1 n=1 Tax=Pelusios castaneus TaxID=367368 RepID=A0A8C8RSU6_9SAUR
MMEQPAEKVVVFPSDDIVLRCEATGNPPLMFRWIKDGHFFDPRREAGVTVVEGSGTLYINNSNTGQHQGTYRCYASNGLGTAMGPEIHVITESTPQWPKEKVTPFEVEEGESVVLPCDPPISAVPPKIYWLNSRIVHIMQDERVSMGQDGYLYFANVLATDSRPDYICHAHYLGPRTIIQKEPLELRVKPTNSVKFRQPRLMVPRGEMSSYVALRGGQPGSGIPTPSVEWTRLNGHLPMERVTFENSQKTLRIREVVEEDEGEYQCTARNTQGIARHSYTVAVEAAPYWAQQPQSRVYGPGESVRLDCSVYGKPTPMVSWWINGLVPEPGRMLRSGALILSEVQANDSLVAQCEAVNSHGRLLANAYVYVIQLPVKILTADGQHYAVVENQTVFLHCRTFGAPVPTVEWFTPQMEPALLDERAMVHTNGTLELSHAQRRDAGPYMCRAQNEQNNATIGAQLQVKGATRIERGPQSAVVKKSSNVTFECLARFDETIQERRHQIHLPPLLRYFIDPTALSIANVDYADQGVYSCRARTALDEAQASAELKVVGRYWLGQEDRRVKLTWTPGDDHNSPIEKFVVEVEDQIREPGVWHEISTVPGLQPSAHLRLPPYGEFRFRVRATNYYGRSEPSPISAPVHTSQAAPERNPKGVSGEGNETNNMVITWQPLARSDWNAPELSYRVQWRLKDRGGRWSEETVTSPPFLVTDTPTFVSYEIKVQAVNPAGKGPDPATVVGYSGEDVPEGYPENVGVEILNSTSVLVSWTPPSKDKLRGHLRGFRVFYLRLGSVGEQSRPGWGGLRPWSHYTLNMVVFNGRGDGPHSEKIKFSTPEGVPGPPGSLVLERVSDTALGLEWTPPEFPNGVLSEYMLQYQQGEWGAGQAECNPLFLPPVAEPWRTSGQANSTHGSYQLANLQPGTSYRIRFVGRNHSGENVSFWETEVETNGTLLMTNQRNFATESWVVAFVCAAALLLLILLILCFVKRSKGGKYSVKDKEDTQVDSEARPMKDETFGEYRWVEAGQMGKVGEGKGMALGSDDSLADYGGSVDVQFNEDGSFIGQYSGHKGKEAAGNDSSGATSPVTATAALE